MKKYFGAIFRTVFIIYFSIALTSLIIDYLKPPIKTFGYQCKTSKEDNKISCGIDEQNKDNIEKWTKDIDRKKNSFLGKFFEPARFKISIKNENRGQLIEPQEPFKRKVSINCNSDFEKEYKYGEEIYSTDFLTLEKINLETKNIEDFISECHPTFESFNSDTSSSTRAIVWAIYDFSSKSDRTSIFLIFVPCFLFVCVLIPSSKELWLFIKKGRNYYK